MISSGNLAINLISAFSSGVERIAKSSGDNNVYFVDGSSFLLSDTADTQIVDQCHPSDGGFLRMAEVIGSVLKIAIRREE